MLSGRTEPADDGIDLGAGVADVAVPRSQELPVDDPREDRAPEPLGVGVVAVAVEAGCEVLVPVHDAFWGDRYAKVKDPFGHEWGIATHKEDIPPEEMGKRAQEFFAKMGGECQT